MPWTYVISDLNGEEIVKMIYEKELQKTNQKEFIAETTIKKKSGKLYVKWKGNKAIILLTVGLIKKHWRNE